MQLVPLLRLKIPRRVRSDRLKQLPIPPRKLRDRVAARAEQASEVTVTIVQTAPSTRTRSHPTPTDNALPGRFLVDMSSAVPFRPAFLIMIISLLSNSGTLPEPKGMSDAVLLPYVVWNAVVFAILNPTPPAVAG